MKTIVTFTWTMEMNSIKQDDEYDEEKNIILARKLRDLIACWPGALGHLSYALCGVCGRSITSGLLRDEKCLHLICSPCSFGCFLIGFK